MNHLPMSPPAPEEQRRTMAQLHALMASQVASYQKSHHLGSSTSVSAELARELMDSVTYTLDQAGGPFAGPDLAQTLRLGQEILEHKLQQARDKLALVLSTAAHRQTECRWEALSYLGRYLRQYDPLHLAHRGPEELFYPILTVPEENIRGIEECLFYLEILWIENQIFAPFSEGALDALFDRLPEGTLNPCEQVLLNALARVLLGKDLTSLVLDPGDREHLQTILLSVKDDTWAEAAETLTQALDLRSEQAVRYARSVLPILRFHLTHHAYPEELFL